LAKPKCKIDKNPFRKYVCYVLLNSKKENIKNMCLLCPVQFKKGCPVQFKKGKHIKIMCLLCPVQFKKRKTYKEILNIPLKSFHYMT
jgi:hypothetical protein